MKRNVKRAALEWDDFVLQKQLKSLMYVDSLSRGNQNMENFIDELNLKNRMRLKRRTTSKFIVGITYKKITIHQEYFDAKNIFSHSFIHNLKHKPKIFQDLSIQMKISLKKQI